MQNNLLNGSIPIGFGNEQRFVLAGNRLSGGIPGDISDSASLSFINISRNQIRSSLPSTILSIHNLQTFLVAENFLSDEVPDQFQACPSLSSLDFSSNSLSGTIPISISSCEKLVSLNLRNHNLTGEIPRQVTTMSALAVPDLSNNSLSGELPESIETSPTLELLNVSYNKLTGPIPMNDFFRTINPDDFRGNSGLCGDKTASKGEWPWRLIVFHRLGFTASDILSCIKESNLIGMGATIIVYKAEMSRSTTVLAVKKLWRSAADIEDGITGDFVGEVNLLGKFRHRNIVRLLGFLYNDKNMGN